MRRREHTQQKNKDHVRNKREAEEEQEEGGGKGLQKKGKKMKAENALVVFT